MGKDQTQALRGKRCVYYGHSSIGIHQYRYLHTCIYTQIRKYGMQTCLRMHINLSVPPSSTGTSTNCSMMMVISSDLTSYLSQRSQAALTMALQASRGSSYIHIQILVYELTNIRICILCIYTYIFHQQYIKKSHLIKKIKENILKFVFQ